MWLPLLENTTIIEQPVDTTTLAPRYVKAAHNFIQTTVEEGQQQQLAHTPVQLLSRYDTVLNLC